MSVTNRVVEISTHYSHHHHHPPTSLTLSLPTNSLHITPYSINFNNLRNSNHKVPLKEDARTMAISTKEICTGKNIQLIINQSLIQLIKPRSYKYPQTPNTISSSGKCCRTHPSYSGDLHRFSRIPTRRYLYLRGINTSTDMECLVAWSYYHSDNVKILHITINHYYFLFASNIKQHIFRISSLKFASEFRVTCTYELWYLLYQSVII